MRRLTLVLTALSLASFSVAVLADDLADAAAKEKARRKAAAPAKVYTEADLPHQGQGPSSTSTDAPAPTSDSPAAKADDTSGKPAGQKPKTDDEIRAEKEKSWRDRLAKTNAKIASLTSDVATLQAAVSDLSQNQFSAGRTAQLQRLDDEKKQLETAQQELTDLQEEGRRMGLRP